MGACLSWQSPELKSVYGRHVATVVAAHAASDVANQPVKLERLNVWSVDLLVRIMRQFLFGTAYPFVHAWELEYVDAIVFDASASYISRLCQVPGLRNRLLAYDTEDACKAGEEHADYHEFDEQEEWYGALLYERAQYTDYAGLTYTQRHRLETRRQEAYDEYKRQIASGELAPDTQFVRDDGRTEEQVQAAARVHLDKRRDEVANTIAQLHYVCPRK
jgi:hypothetical protein